jgi:hypothetical protein
MNARRFLKGEEMKNRNWMLLSGALLAATGCNSNSKSEAGQPSAERGAGEGESSASANAAAPAPVERGEQSELLVGRWSQDPGCERVLDLRADGTLTAFDGAEGTWSTSGEGEEMVLTMRRPSEVASLKVSGLTQDGFSISDGAAQGGTTFDMARCS